MLGHALQSGGNISKKLAKNRSYMSKIIQIRYNNYKRLVKYYHYFRITPIKFTLPNGNRHETTNSAKGRFSENVAQAKWFIGRNAGFGFYF